MLLNADYAPVQVISWERAVGLILAEKVRAVVNYAGRKIRSPSFSMDWPAVISLVKYVKVRAMPKLNRRNVLARDNFACQYCGYTPVHFKGRLSLHELTLDHVVPRSQARGGRVRVPWCKERVDVTSWQNLVTACRGCNCRKADRTPQQAGLKLRSMPRSPSTRDTVRIALSRVQVPPEWSDFVV